jgi:hypothetical protein
MVKYQLNLGCGEYMYKYLEELIPFLTKFLERKEPLLR